jgi:NAD(P)-dependent dehydrogenase (short-subunit alcohol dehydrogenase family)
MDINVVGTFNVVRLAAERMAKLEPMNADGQRGVLINVASVSAYEGTICTFGAQHWPTNSTISN